MVKTAYAYRTTYSLVLGLALAGLNADAAAQIGGKMAIDGPFLIDDAEDLNLNSASLNREWVPDYNGGQPALTVKSPASASVTTYSGQSPLGLFHLSGKASFNFVGKGFGVPVPSQPGMSTLTHPGNLTSFESLSFLACSPSTATGLRFQVTLESYPQNPDTTYPKMHWTFSPPQGTAMGPVSIDLWSPDAFKGAEAEDVESLLANARYLSFYAFAAPVSNSVVVDFYVDDITLMPGTTGFRDSFWVMID